MTRLRDLYWAAGFLDGEGCFQKAGHVLCATATQKDPWPLLRLQAILGGKVCFPNGYWRWNAYGAKAVGIMMTLYPLLSPRRQSKIRELLSWWESIGLVGSHWKRKRDEAA